MRQEEDEVEQVGVVRRNIGKGGKAGKSRGQRLILCLKRTSPVAKFTLHFWAAGQKQGNSLDRG